MKEKYLDSNTIKQQVAWSRKTISGGAFLSIVLVFVVIWVVCSWGSVSNFLWAALLFVPLIGLLAYVYWMLQRRSRAIENMDYCLSEDTCVKKKFIKGDADSDDRFVLYFKENGKFAECNDCQYERIAVGDQCYLLHLGGSKKTYWAFNKYDWQGLIGFEKRGDFYYPQR